MNVNTCYSIINYACNKNQQGNVTPDQFNLIINQAALSFMDYLLGQFQQYQPMRPFSRVQYGQNETTRQRLTPLIYEYILNLDASGFVSYPGDYEQTDAMWKLYGFERIRYVQQDQLWFVYNSVINPYQTNPFHLIKDEGFQFYPASLNQTRLSYVRTPPTIVWGYDLDVGGRPVYNPAKSTDPVFYDTDMLEVLVRALRLVGVNLQAAQVSQYAEEIKQQGQ